MDHFWHFNGLFSTQNINITRFSVIFKHRDTVLLGDFEIMFALVFSGCCFGGKRRGEQ